MVSLIGATTTRTGLAVTAELDPAPYPTGKRIPAAEVDRLPLHRHEWHGEWNYTLRPESPEQAPDPAFGRFPEGDKHPAWLHHPALTGLDEDTWTALVDQYHSYLAEHPTVLPFATRRVGNKGIRLLSAADRLLVAILKRRWKTPNTLLNELFGVSQAAIGGALREAGPDLDALHAPITRGTRTIKTEPELQALIQLGPDANGPKQTKD